MTMAITKQGWDELSKKADGIGLKGLSKEERGEYMFNSFQKGHLSLRIVLELLGLDGCDDCGKIVEIGEEHSREECTVWRVMES